MIHAGSAGFPRSSLPDLEIQAREFLELREIMEEIYGLHTGHDPEKLRKDMERDRFMSPLQAVEYGLIDRVISPREVTRFSPNPLDDAGQG
jgi:ATP-dependent Clp protease protease subunit